VNRQVGVWAALVFWVPLSAASAGPRTPDLQAINRELHGHVVDYTHNHGADRRLWSSALNQPRDLYIYLPPGFDPGQQYPLMIFLHGFAQDEQAFLKYGVCPLDRNIVTGKLPPMIVAVPDGSLTGEPCLRTAGSFFINSNAGNYEDYVMHDVWNFVHLHYPIRPEPEAHVLGGISMGGGGAYNLAMKYRDRVHVVFGVFPPVNTRWVDCHCRYRSPFDPCCWGWRTDFSRGHEVVARFYGVITIRLKDVVDKIYGRNPETAARVSSENPIELIDRLGLREGELAMYIAYAGKDEFNIAAQVESFLYRAKERGLSVAVGYEPEGHHDVTTARKLFPGLVEWLGPQLAPYSPPLLPGAAAGCIPGPGH
jgi:S-formylglutathione hydrolase FrmB